jgi:putative membrane protein insertion efficiency factor
MNVLTKLCSLLLIGVARGYQLFVSPVLPQTCRYHPTCSGYTIDAVREHGPARGGLLALRRIVRCHPWGGSGYDPVPEADRQ